MRKLAALALAAVLTVGPLATVASAGKRQHQPTPTGQEWHRPALSGNSWS